MKTRAKVLCAACLAGFGVATVAWGTEFKSRSMTDGSPAWKVAATREHGGGTRGPDAARCQTIAKRIDWLTSRLRAGYRAKEGERWKQQLRDLKKERRSRCRV